MGTELTRRGHTVRLAAPRGQQRLCEQAFAGTGVGLLPAPELAPSATRLKYPCTYPDLLHDCGYASPGNVSAAVGGWLRLFDSYAPDLLIADHSPTSLLASRLRSHATLATGTGFACPPDFSPQPSLRAEIPQPHWGEVVEQKVLEAMNWAMDQHRAPPLSRVTEIFATLDARPLLTFKAIDHYADWRAQEASPPDYWQPFGTLPGAPCDWPRGPRIAPNSPRVFVYLRDPSTETPLLRGLAYKRIATVCYSARMSEAEREQFAGSSVLISPSLMVLAPLLEGCTVAVLHGGHGFVSLLMLAGVPMVLVPKSLEQRVTAEKICQLGVGLQAQEGDLNGLGAALEQLLEDGSYRDRSAALSGALGGQDERAALHEFVDAAEGTLAAR
ncbi:MAG: hypothetical protein KDA37_13750 [Planctomycetales bacterium]|nr:hypothetical protein [Planctomycetales bacterium]